MGHILTLIAEIITFAIFLVGGLVLLSIVFKFFVGG